MGIGESLRSSLEDERNLVVFCFLSVTYQKFVFSQFQEEAFVTILTPVKKSIKSGKLLASGHTCTVRIFSEIDVKTLYVIRYIR